MTDRFLVTGATGFVGACLTRFLVKKNKKVSILTRSKKLNWRLQDIASKITTYECDILSSSLGDVVKRVNPTVVFHLASYGSLSNEVDTNRMIDVNIKGTRNIINSIKNIHFRLLVNTGSSSEYGSKTSSIKESDTLSPMNDYGVTKTAATLLCSEVAHSERMPIITLRLFSPYGYFEEKDRLIPSIILSILNNKLVKLSSPTFVRDFIFIDDVVNAYVAATQITFKPGEIINIGSGHQHSIKEVLDAILHATKSDPKVAWNTVKKQPRQEEPKLWQADITKARNILKWRPDYTLDKGVVKAVNWFKINNELYDY